MDLDEEIRPIKGFNKYFVSNKGNIYSIQSKKIKKLKFGYKGKKIYKYKSVCIWKDKKCYNFYVHRLVLDHFLSECPKGLEACHGKNGREDNSIENLSWKTRKENLSNDKIRDGTIRRGEKSNLSKITERDAVLIKYLLKMNHKAKYIASIIGVSTNTVYSIKYNRAWKWLDEPQKQFDGKDFL